MTRWVSFVDNNPLVYTDPTGHVVSCDGQTGGGCRVEKPDVPLTDVKINQGGKSVRDLYNLFLKTPGYWADLIAKGADPFTLFVAILLSRESGPLWNGENSPWGTGGPSDGKEPFQNAMSHWLGGWVKDVYGVNFGNLSSSGKMNAVFNLLGTMKSVEGVINASHGVSEVLNRVLTECRGSRSCVSSPATIPNSQYSGLPSDGERLEKVLNPSEYNVDLYGMTANALSHPETGYWTWGNINRGQDIPSNAIYVFGYDSPRPFVILNGYKK